MAHRHTVDSQLAADHLRHLPLAQPRRLSAHITFSLPRWLKAESPFG
ncbi:MAG TPA: hypothetical protein VFA09_06935 [Ktedonobacteraceae bacterium]|nr:hypothetical protein [Ktedonobacteraceae bacterium]